MLINPQYAPKILVKPGIDQSVDAITAAARDAEVGLFNRFVAMRYWHETEKLPFEHFITPDGLHMNDWGYACVAKLLAAALTDDIKPPAATAIVGAGCPPLNFLQRAQHVLQQIVCMLEPA